MNRFCRFIAMLLIAVWVPITSHCYLEESGLFEIEQEQCCTKDAAAPSQGDPCDTGCKIIEKAGAKIQTFQKTLLPFRQPVLCSPENRPRQFVSAQLKIATWPTPSLHLPQFVNQTSLPVRAPSKVS